MKKLLILVSIMGMFLLTTGFTNSYEVKYEQYARELQDIGVFQGTGEGFELERQPTRLEGLVMLIRLLGVEDEALSMNNNPCIFEDVPNWGQAYVNYAYENGLTKGINDKLFGAKELLDVKGFSTFLLRSLGYSDVNGDFDYKGSLTKIYTKGIINAELYEELSAPDNIFRRDYIAIMAYNSLETKTKSEFNKSKVFLSSNYKKDYVSITIEDNKALNIKGKCENKDAKYILINVEKDDGATKTIKLKTNNLGEFEGKLVINKDSGKYIYDMYTAPKEYTRYNSWIWNIPLVKEDDDLYFPQAMVYEQNYEQFYFGKNDLDLNELLKPSYGVESDDSDIIKLSNDIVKGIDTDYEKLLAIHDWVADNIYYNYDGYYLGEYGDTSSKGTLESKMSVCQGYANLTAALVRASNIPCRVVSGFSLGISTSGKWTKDNVGNNPNHAWNEAYLDGRWVILDVTWSSKNKYEDGKFIHNGFDRAYFDPTLESFSMEHKIME